MRREWQKSFKTLLHLFFFRNEATVATSSHKKNVQRWLWFNFLSLCDFFVISSLKMKEDTFAEYISFTCWMVTSLLFASVWPWRAVTLLFFQPLNWSNICSGQNSDGRLLGHTWWCWYVFGSRCCSEASGQCHFLTPLNVVNCRCLSHIEHLQVAQPRAVVTTIFRNCEKPRLDHKAVIKTTSIHTGNITHTSKGQNGQRLYFHSTPHYGVWVELAKWQSVECRTSLTLVEFSLVTKLFISISRFPKSSNHIAGILTEIPLMLRVSLMWIHSKLLRHLIMKSLFYEECAYIL